MQIKEEELLRARYAGEAIKILQETVHIAYDPEEFLKVIVTRLYYVILQTVILFSLTM